MADGQDKLAPPAKVHTEDPGAHDLESESDDHFSDAQSAPSDSKLGSPATPKTRVEKVDNEPSFGEVPGTEAYRKRESDAEPDEVAVIPDPSSSNQEAERDGEDKAPAVDVPKTLVVETEDSEGSVTHPEKHHDLDPLPDMVIKGVEAKADGQVDTPILSPSLSTPTTEPVAASQNGPGQNAPTTPEEVDPAEVSPSENFQNGDNDDFGDDFDDFEEGGGGGDDDDDDFGDFDDGFQEPTAPEAAPTPTAAAPQPPQAYTLSFPVPDFEGLDPNAVMAAVEPYINAIYPPDYDDIPTAHSYPRENPIFQTPRSASLWAQLVAPPPLQPPDWIRSRIRRLFLVSLGVPVDLDEILPASKQKKLVLPSLNRVGSNGSLRTSSDSRNVARLKQEAGASTTSLDSQGNKKPRQSGDAGAPANRRKKNEPVEPVFDLVAARQLCMTTDEALHGFTDRELKEHVAKLEAIQVTAKEVLGYWQKRTDEKIGDREAFEGVIESLVKHARKVRK